MHPVLGVPLSKFRAGKGFMNIEDLWRKALNILQNEINPNSFSQMFKNIKPKALTKDTIVLLIENSFHKDAIEKRFLIIFL